ncbi:MAG: ABC transporter permease, partial [Chloroflexi bacterium]|nr:ABC transporter permease [Chloroflexota bacterium]
EPREGQQIAGLFTLPVMLPLMVLPALVENPNGAIAVTLSLIPFTAPMALPVRAAFTTVPTWQLILSIGLVWLLAVGALWFAGRAFRLGMLRIGKRVRLREIFRKEAAQ